MTEKEAFHFGFLLRCAEEGLDEDETGRRMKQAALGWGDAASFLGSALKTVLGTGAKATALAVPVAGLGGYAAGHFGGGLAANAIDPGYTPDEINRQELLATYSDLADALEGRVKRRKELES